MRILKCSRLAAASVAVMALVACLVVPALAQVLWSGDDEVSVSGGVTTVWATPGNSVGYDRTYPVTSIDSTGPSVTGPSSITVPAYAYFGSADFQIGAGTTQDMVVIRAEDQDHAFEMNVFFVE